MLWPSVSRSEGNAAPRRMTRRRLPIRPSRPLRCRSHSGAMTGGGIDQRPDFARLLFASIIRWQLPRSPLSAKQTLCRDHGASSQMNKPCHRAMRIKTGALLATALLLIPAGPAAADDGGDFYHGRTLTVLISYSVGGGYDLYARVLAR